jgi:hypothetical protein
VSLSDLASHQSMILGLALPHFIGGTSEFGDVQFLVLTLERAG